MNNTDMWIDVVLFILIIFLAVIMVITMQWEALFIGSLLSIGVRSINANLLVISEKMR